MAKKFEHLKGLQKELNELLPVSGTFLEEQLCRKITNVLVTYEEYKMVERNLPSREYLLEREAKKRLFEEALNEAKVMLLHVEKTTATPL